MAKVFISYSHLDEGWKERVVKQLKVLADLGLEVWDDRRIQAGADWEKDIETALRSCDAALLLISADFLTSAYITTKEVPALLERREKEGLLVIPVILSPCQWQRKLWLKPIQARPKAEEGLSGMTPHEAEKALSGLAGEVMDLIAGPKQQHPPHSDPSSEDAFQGQDDLQGLHGVFIKALAKRFNLAASEEAIREHLVREADRAIQQSPDDRKNTVTQNINALCAAMDAARIQDETAPVTQTERQQVNDLAQSLAMELLGRMVRWPGEAAEMNRGVIVTQPVSLTALAVMMQSVTGGIIEIIPNNLKASQPDDMVEYPCLLKVQPTPNGPVTLELDALLWAIHQQVFTEEIVTNE